MDIISLEGAWTLREVGGNVDYPAVVPGCTFTDLMANGVIPDPIVGVNEDKVQWVGEKDWKYSHTFDVPASVTCKSHARLHFDMLDTLCEVFVNGKSVGKGDNVNRTYFFDVKQLIKVGENILEIVFFSPLPYIEKLQNEFPMPNSTMGEAGSCHIRKSPYHFGWDWGPHLLCAGISRACTLEAYDIRIDDVRITQKIEKNKASIGVKTSCDDAEGVEIKCALSIEGETVASSDGSDAVLTVDNPRLWWCNGMGEQPLYTLLVTAVKDGLVQDEKILEIGLRTIELDTSPDAYGNNFCFKVNGERIFARGANWIASDNFIGRTSYRALEDRISKAATANMNMLRVWGGAYYESNEFYSLCDKYGILVWQDMNFACQAYPLMREDFIQNLRLEVRDNVTRLRAHACLALWAGNNEIESMSLAWAYRRDLIKQTGDFFWTTLRNWINESDGVTPYHPCTPSGREYMKDINADDCGDTHLWQVWHGLRPLEYYRKRNTRFCSEFGIESFPSLNALDIYAKDCELTSLNSPVMKAHQKCIGGNGKMLYYVLSKYWTPTNFLDLVYLTQLTQAQCVQNATEGWRLKKGRCNGSLYWQYNDCWGVCSWAGMDYYGNLKAVQYNAKYFNAPISAILQWEKSSCKVSAVNDSRTALPVRLICGIVDFSGNVKAEKSFELTLEPSTSTTCCELSPKGVKDIDKRQCLYYCFIYDKDGNVVSRRSIPLAPEKKADLPDPDLSYSTEEEDGGLTITLRARRYARYVELRMRGSDAPFDDNYFDLLPCEKRVIHIAEGKESDFSARSLYDVGRKNCSFKDALASAKIFLTPVNFINWFGRLIGID